MSENEIKPSFTSRYIFFTIITSTIIAGVSVGVNTIFKSRPIRQLVVYESSLADLINSTSFQGSQIEASYYISSNPRKEIKSLFRKTIIIKNAGNEGVEDLLLTFSIQEDEAFLVPSPKVETSPKSIVDALNLSKIDKSSSNKKHLWTVPLLNQDESIIFEYNIYSEKKTR